MKANQNDLDSIISLGRDMRIAMVRFLPPRRLGRAVSSWERIQPAGWPESLDSFYGRLFSMAESAGENPCLSPGQADLVPNISPQPGDGWFCPLGTTLAIDSDGEAYPCAALMYREFRLGNVHRRTLREIQDSGKMAEIVASMQVRMTRIEACRACDWRSLCRSGCMALARDHRGSIWGVDHHCGLRKNLYLKAFQRVADGAVLNHVATECA
jgi:radical SAM protein with 4Fe4S-binding SPASM domain